MNLWVRTLTILFLGGSMVHSTVNGAETKSLRHGRQIASPREAKPAIRSSSDLPRFRYLVEASSAGALLRSEPQITALLAAVRRNDETLLTAWEIEDHSTLRQVHTDFLNMDMLQGRFAEARQEIGAIRQFEDKPAIRAFDGLFEEAFIDAQLATESNPSRLAQAFLETFRKRLDEQDWNTIKDPVKIWKGRYQTVSEAFFEGFADHDLSPQIQNDHALDAKGASELLAFAAQIRFLVPLKSEYVKACSSYIAAHTISKPEIWSAIDVSLLPSDKASLVRVAVWDSGVDIAAFKNNVGKSGLPPLIAWDVNFRPSSGYLLPLTQDQQLAWTAFRPILKGLMDLEANIDSPAANSAKQLLSTSTSEEVARLWEQKDLYLDYVHGSHVAGIALRGNPFARLVVARFEPERSHPPRLITAERTQQLANSVQQTIHFLQRERVRVVNMSWMMNPAVFEDNLAKNGVGRDASERKQMALQMYTQVKTILFNSIRAANDILFICSASNSNADSTFTATVPASFSLPNLIAVGAVDAAGDEVDFTNYGPTIIVYANGSNILSKIPGNDSMLMSGTSMAAPNVTNLAGKLFALSPSLTPAQVAHLIQSGSTRKSDRVWLINPKLSVALLKQPGLAGKE